MGIDALGLKFLIYAANRGTDFSSVLTLGRQHILVPPSTVSRVVGMYCRHQAHREAFSHYIEGLYCDNVLTCLGAKRVEAIDASAYEGASILHDMNHQIPERYKQTFSVVLDFGTLEHIFNFPVAIKNAMEMIKMEGHFVCVTVANNFMGHGFYQFSPELLFAVFSEENGFRVIDMVISEAYEDSSWYHVSRPKGDIAGRVTLVNHEPTFLMCIAQRVSVSEKVFQRMPVQYDYVKSWEDTYEKNTEPLNNKEQITFYAKMARLLRKFSLISRIFRFLRYIVRPAFREGVYTKFVWHAQYEVEKDG